MRVYVCYINYGYEGKSEPLQVFRDAAAASAWKQGAEDSHGDTVEIKAMNVIGNEPGGE